MKEEPLDLEKSKNEFDFAIDDNSIRDSGFLIDFENIDNMIDGRNIQATKSHFAKGDNPGLMSSGHELENTRATELPRLPPKKEKDYLRPTRDASRSKSRDRLTNNQVNPKKSFFKKMWYKAPALNKNTYKIQFGIQGEKVRFHLHNSYPMFILGVKFKPEIKTYGGQNYSKDIS